MFFLNCQNKWYCRIKHRPKEFNVSEENEDSSYVSKDMMPSSESDQEEEEEDEHFENPK